MIQRVGVLDDSSEFQNLAAMMFSYLGITNLQQWHSSVEALPQLQATPPDLLLLDIMMAGLSGLDIWAELRATKATKNLPIIVCTAAINRIIDDEQRLSDSHTIILPKPFTLDQLRDALDQLTPGWQPQ